MSGTTAKLKRNSLPVPLTRFIGREAEIIEIRRLLTSQRLVTLTGIGGSGKTRLALQVAAELADEHAGVTLVDLAPVTDPSLLPNVVAAAFGLRESLARPMIEALAEFLRPLQVLLVLDNCEQLIPACAALARSLATTCPELTVLATSRQPLGIDGELVWRVPPMELPDPENLRGRDVTKCEAVRLFADRATLVQPGFVMTPDSAEAVARICCRLDGIPLAIELAAARVQLLSVHQIADRLGDRFRLLTSSSRIAQPRHQTLQGVVDWSHQLLSETERTLFRRLSVFPGSFSLEAAEAICADATLPSGAVMGLLEGLSGKSLVVVEPRGRDYRFRLPETIREYGANRLQEAGESIRLQDRHLKWHLSLAEEAVERLHGPEQAAWLDRLELEHDNMRAALRWAKERGEDDLTLRLASALWWFWYVRGYMSEGRLWLATALAGAATNLSVRAEAARAAGLLAREQGQYEEAEYWGEEGLRLARELGDEAGVAKSLNNLGIVALERGNFDRAFQLYEESLAIHRAEANAYGMARSLGNLGYAALKMGDYGRAQAYFEESLGYSRRIEDTQSLAMTLNFLGMIEQHQGQHERAFERCQEALELGHSLGDKRTVARALVGLGRVAESRGDLAASRSYRCEVLTLRRELQDRGGIVEGLEEIAQLDVRQGAFTRAAHLLGAAAALRTQIGAALPPDGRVLVSACETAIAQALGPAETAEAEAYGRTLGTDQAIKLALTLPERTAPRKAEESQPGAEWQRVGLSGREVQIVQLTAQGLTAKEIGNTLHLSPRTVEKHQETIRAKVGVPNRAALVAWAMKSGLPDVLVEA